MEWGGMEWGGGIDWMGMRGVCVEMESGDTSINLVLRISVSSSSDLYLRIVT